jgi:hypothetical protein
MHNQPGLVSLRSPDISTPGWTSHDAETGAVRPRASVRPSKSLPFRNNASSLPFPYAGKFSNHSPRPLVCGACVRVLGDLLRPLDCFLFFFCFISSDFAAAAAHALDGFTLTPHDTVSTAGELAAPVVDTLTFAIRSTRDFRTASLSLPLPVLSARSYSTRRDLP